MNGKTKLKVALPATALFLLTFCLFQFLYHFDNKYTTTFVLGEDGDFFFSENELNRPLFLIDGWEIYPDTRLTPVQINSGEAPAPQEIFIGQYSNFSYLNKAGSPFGSATYRLVLHYDGAPRTLIMNISEVFTDYILWVDGEPIAKTGSGSNVAITVDNETELVISVENHTHYYSGIYYPPAIGTAAVMQKMSLLQNMFYGFLCAFSLALCLFFVIDRRHKHAEAVFTHFGLLCLFFAIHCTYPFLRQLGLQSPFWYGVEDASWLLVLYEAIMLSTRAAGLHDTRGFLRAVRPIALGAAALCMICVTFIIPSNPSLIAGYGQLLDGYKLVCWLHLLFCAVWGVYRRQKAGGFLLAAGAALGAAQVINLLDNNRFEPIYGGWQIEYAGFFLVLIFWAMANAYLRELRRQNAQLTEHLEDLVQLRTTELHAVLRERKSFFSDMAHNLKAPIAAIHGFISLIMQENLYLDEELRDYLTQISRENNELQQRMESLSGLNAIDKIAEQSETLEINELLRQVREDNEPEACVSGIHLGVGYLGTTAYVRAQRKKLLILFENLIYNSLSFTPEDGAITIAPRLEGEFVIIDVADTGCGIAPEHLPHIFERFFTVRDRPHEGSGLGLYIARLTVEELGGELSAASQPGEGTSFRIKLPLA